MPAQLQHMISQRVGQWRDQLRVREHSLNGRVARHLVTECALNPAIYCVIQVKFEAAFSEPEPL